MAFRLGDAVIRGELFNVRKNSTHGWLQLRGLRRPVMFELTGNCGPTCTASTSASRCGTSPRTSRRRRGDDGDRAAGSKELGLSGLRWHQIGPTGEMTAARKVRVADCSPEELYMRLQAGRAAADRVEAVPLPRVVQPERAGGPGTRRSGDRVRQRRGRGRERRERHRAAKEDARKDFEADADADSDTSTSEEDPELEGGGLSITAITHDGDTYEVRDVTPTADDECECDDEDCCGGLGGVRRRAQVARARAGEPVPRARPRLAVEADDELARWS